MAILIRKACEQDASVLSSLNADVQAIHATALPWLFKRPGPDTFPPAEVAALLARDENLLFIADCNGAAAGYAYAEIMRWPETSFNNANEIVYIHHISVSPPFRRRGVGAALIGAVRTAARDAGIARVGLDVWTFNAPARTFFRRRGFVPYVERLWSPAHGDGAGQAETNPIAADPD
jgi:ribosomal protein S18 acetylase RimI-like enzyme